MSTGEMGGPSRHLGVRAQHPAHRVEEGEDSLGDGLEQQLVEFNDMKKAIDDMSNVFTTLQRQCTALKSRQQELEANCEQRTRDISTPNSEIDRLTSDRDVLQLEHERSKAAPKDRITRWPSIEAGQFPGYASGSPAPSDLLEGDVQGRLTRQNWVLKERVRKLKEENERAAKAHQEAYESELAISEGLRDRIGELESKRRQLKMEKEEVEKREKEVQDALDNSEVIRKDMEGRMKRDRQDLEDMVLKERAEKDDLKAQLDNMRQQKEAVQAELTAMREQPAQGVQRCAQLKHQVFIAQADPLCRLSPPRILQSREPNIPLSAVPMTPTKPKLKAYPSLLASPSAPTSPKHDLSRRLTHLEAAFTHLSQTHKSLKTAYDDLRDIHKKDLVHMQEYKKSLAAREAEKKKRREERRAKRDGASISMTQAELGPISVAIATSGQTVTADEQRENILVEESESLPKLPKATIQGQQKHNSIQLNQHRESTLSDHGYEEEYSQPMLPLPAATQVKVTSVSNAATPEPEQAQGRRAVQPAHVTPWLGGTTEAGPSRRLTATRPRDEDDDFVSPPNHLATPTAARTPRTPLVRDRTGSEATSTSLRKMVMRQAVKTVQPVETPVRQSVRQSTPSTPRASSLTPNALGSIAPSTGKKRKVIDVDMEGLTPHEKAVKRKQIARMPASERRELYKDYKGKGRYVRPEDVNTSVREEYEIDPEQNEGAAFAFHDVKRKKAERKGMHGGDCECCKDYYEAVGEIPRFNQAPAWRDDTNPQNGTGQREEEDAVREHQNKVSRHRETWTKPPTPPGYWSIGFPSTQDVEAQNERADAMAAEKEARLRREVTRNDGKWRKKN